MKPQSFISKLASANTEEAVKATYVKFLDLDFDNPDNIDLYIPPVIFEFKYNQRLEKESVRAKILAQALYYIRRIRHGKTKTAPISTICLADKDQAFFVEVRPYLHIVDNNKFDWRRAPSTPDPNIAKAIRESGVDATGLFYIKDADSAIQFKTALCTVLHGGDVPWKRLITKENFEEVYIHWKSTIGSSIDTKKNAPSLPWMFVQDTCCHVVFDSVSGDLIFKTTMQKVQVSPLVYTSFWQQYERPPETRAQEIIFSGVDRLSAIEKRRYNGMFYTPEPFCSLSIKYIEKLLGPNWQNEYVIYDPCCGTGNLEMPLENYNNLFMSTLEQEEVDHLNNEKVFPGATIFQFDFLNDPIEKMPALLIDALKNKKVLILMNPPYVESGKGVGEKQIRRGTSNTRVKTEQDIGKAGNELFIQFLMRTQEICPHAMVGCFSKLKFIAAPAYQKFRETYQGKVVDGFIFPSWVFHGTKGKWPVAFSVIEPGGTIQDAKYDVLDDKGNKIGEKIIKMPGTLINQWFERPKNNVPFVPLTSAISVNDNASLDKICPRYLGFSVSHSQDIQQSKICCLLSAPFSDGGGSSIVSGNYEKALVSLAVRKSITQTWLNDRDQFHVPNTGLPQEFVVDCIVWNLFSGHNQTSSFTAEYKGQNYFIRNEFYPYSLVVAKEYGPQIVGFQKAVEKDKETYTCLYLDQQNLSLEAEEVLKLGLKIYQTFFQNWSNVKKHTWKIENHMPGWYQIRNAMKEMGIEPELFSKMKELQKRLQNKIVPQVYEYGFLTIEMLYEEASEND